MTLIPGSSYLEFLNWRMNDATTVPEAFGFSGGNLYPLTSDMELHLALIIERANDPEALLAQRWADRQSDLAGLEAAGTLWDVYGGRQADYDAVQAGLATAGIAVEDAATGYVSSAESRTLWVSVTPQEFFDLTGQRLYWVGGSASDPFAVYWEGELNLPDAWAGLVDALWVDTFVVPDQSGTGAAVTLPQGPQSPGNSTSLDYEAVSYYASTIAQLYNFPLAADSSLVTGIIGLVEPQVGDRLPPAVTDSFQTLLDQFRASAGLPTGAGYYNVGPTGPWSEVWGRAGERSEDVGVVAAVNAGATLGLYSGPGLTGQSNFTGYQSAIWDTVNNPAILSSSWSDPMSTAPGSAFYRAYRELFVDAALRNITVFTDSSDGGSGAQTGNGRTNVWQNNLSSYAIVVGGTSLTTGAAAQTDPTLASWVAAADAMDRTVLATMIAGGLKTLPGGNALSVFMETAWNQYVLSGNTLDPGYLTNETGTGGVDITQSVPSYQQAFGLTPQGSGPDTGIGRGVPDVSAVAGGNMFYITPYEGMVDIGGGIIGTSAATPLWASLGLQINTILRDQGVPFDLGYMNDLLYQAAVIAPGSFNDVTVGSIISSFYYGGAISTPDGDGGTASITPTGFGYSAGAGYDLVTGLGTPNGVLLSRALSCIVHTQIWSDAPSLATDGGSGLFSTVDQSLLIQPVLGFTGGWQAHVGGQTVSGAGATHPEAWSRQFAQQVLQWDFDPDLILLFDGLPQARPHEMLAASGAGFTATIGGLGTLTPQASLSLPYGFVDFVGDGGASAVEFARPVAIAANAGGADDQEAVVRVRQSGASDSLALMFYRVDTLDGVIGGIRPGDAAYAGLVIERAYELESGGIWLNGPGYGQYGQSALLDVDQGDIIAMSLTNGYEGVTHTYYAFAAANEQVGGTGVAHLWNYGLNTWGWEDLYGGGDLDYNDLVVQLDFTSSAGAGILI
ncbi:MAG: hypothetical protein B7Y70_01180 [Rhizobiales bacterium 35-68-8]|nr:MAG: hypothetical protein B7Y70_01180 [Rhizobiales bacterium 35-68-8]